MRRWLALLFLLPLASCGATAQVKLQWTNPATNAISGQCADAGTALTDLKGMRIWRQVVGRTDSTLVVDRPAKAGLADSFVATIPETLYDFWGGWYDSTGNASCRSNTVRMRAAQAPMAGTMQ